MREISDADRDVLEDLFDEDDELIDDAIELCETYALMGKPTSARTVRKELACLRKAIEGLSFDAWRHILDRYDVNHREVGVAVGLAAGEEIFGPAGYRAALDADAVDDDPVRDLYDAAYADDFPISTRPDIATLRKSFAREVADLAGRADIEISANPSCEFTELLGVMIRLARLVGNHDKPPNPTTLARELLDEREE